MGRGWVFEHAPFPNCHASSIAQAGDGRLWCVWFGGTREKNSDNGIWISQFKDGKWSAPMEFANGLTAGGKRYASWNPVIFALADGRLVCTYLLGDSPRKWSGFYRVSRDNGQTWTAAREMPEGLTGPVRNPPLELGDGRIVVPSSTEFHSMFGWRAHFELSDDGGKTWKSVPVAANGINAIQPAVVALKDGRLQALARTRSGRIAVSFSGNGGESWSELEKLEAENPNSGLCVLGLRDGRFLMVHNPGKAGRGRLAVSLSEDGIHWREALVLQDGVEGEEYSYPSAIQARDGRVHITYTWRRSRIAHDIIEPSKL